MLMTFKKLNCQISNHLNKNGEMDNIVSLISKIVLPVKTIKTFFKSIYTYQLDYITVSVNMNELNKIMIVFRVLCFL